MDINFTQTINAIWWERGNCFYHFGIHTKVASLYGEKSEDIVAVILSVHPDQTKYEPKKGVPDYWGYFDIEEQQFTFVYPSLWQLEICSPDFFRSNIEKGEGEIVRLEVGYYDLTFAEKNI